MTEHATIDPQALEPLYATWAIPVKHRVKADADVLVGSLFPGADGDVGDPTRHKIPGFRQTISPGERLRG